MASDVCAERRSSAIVPLNANGMSPVGQYRRVPRALHREPMAALAAATTTEAIAAQVDTRPAAASSRPSSLQQLRDSSNCTDSGSSGHFGAAGPNAASGAASATMALVSSRSVLTKSDEELVRTVLRSLS